MILNPFDKSNYVDNLSSYSKKSVSSLLDGDFYNPGASNAQTQKARGIFFIMSKRRALSTAFDWTVPKHILFGAGTTFKDYNFNYPVFVRPCPTIPRHGFVDSISCNNAEEVNAISKQSFDEEPNSEILITKPINASYGAILTDGTLTFAVGNDGATSGKNVKYFYISEDPIGDTISLDPTVLLEGEVPFYELVLDTEGNTNLVQVRSAPGVPKCKDFVPNEVTVKNIIKADGDLLAWEKIMQDADPSTTIVDHTNGSLASHYAIHAIINKIPIFTSYLPQLNEVVPATVIDSEISDNDRQKFKRAFEYGFNSASYTLKNSKFSRSKILYIMKNTVKLALASLHNFSSISMAKDYEVIGITLGLFLRTAFAVSIGEARYCKDSKCSSDLRQWKSVIPGSRDGAYYWSYNRSGEESLKDASNAFRIFNECSWSSSFGGKKWASCTKSSIELFNACVGGDINSIVGMFNKVIHEEHNGGKYLNKIIDVSHFDHAAKNPSVFALRNLSGIIDMLATSWDYSVSNEVKDTNTSLKKIDMVFVEQKYKIKVANQDGINTEYAFTKIKLCVVDGKASEIEVELNNKINISVYLPLRYQAGISSNKASHKLIGSSVPYCWSFENYTISKNIVKKLVEHTLKSSYPKKAEKTINIINDAAEQMNNTQIIKDGLSSNATPLMTFIIPSAKLSSKHADIQKEKSDFHSKLQELLSIANKLK